MSPESTPGSSDKPPASAAPSARDDLNPENWVALHGDVLFSYAVVRVNDRGIAEDLVQETLLSAVRGLKNFRGSASVRTWLVQILRNKIVDYFRSRTNVQMPQTIDVEAEAATEFSRHGHWRETLGRWPANPAEALLRAEFWQVFDACRQKLPKTLAAAFTLREMDGQTTEHVCEQLGVSAANLSVRIYRARLLMRRCLDRNWFQHEK